MKKQAPEFIQLLKSFHLRIECPPFAQSYKMAVREAAKRGHPVLSITAAKRRLDETVPQTVQILARHGDAALRKHYGHKQRRGAES